MSCDARILFKERFVNVYFTPTSYMKMLAKIRILFPYFGTEGTFLESVAMQWLEIRD